MTVALIDKKKCPSCDEWKNGSEFHKGAWYCKPCANSKTRQYHREHKGTGPYERSKRNSWVKRAHGITLDEYETKLKSQGNICAICSTVLLDSGGGTHLDHCHRTGKLRDFLCTNCNRAIGHFKESSEIMRKAIDYLERHK